MVNKDLFTALRIFQNERGIQMDFMLEQIQKAITIACKNSYGGNENVVFDINPKNNTFDVKLVKTVVEEVVNPNYEITVQDALKIDAGKKYNINDEIEIPLNTKHLGRIAVAAARNVIRQGIRDGEKGQMRLEFQSKLGEIVSAMVEKIDNKTGVATIKIGKNEALLPKSEQVGCSDLKEGDHVKVFIADVKDGDKGPRAIISRTRPEFVKRLFEQEVPEIYEGIVEIKSISREAGSRTKMAVLSNKPEIDPIGACIGTKGMRVNSIVNELGGEKIDIVEYSYDYKEFVSAALSPADVCKVEILDEEAKSCEVTVPDHQLSLAIGNKGQNVRLAAKLTGWRIDIRPESGFFGEDIDDELTEEE